MTSGPDHRKVFALPSWCGLGVILAAVWLPCVLHAQPATEKVQDKKSLRVVAKPAMPFVLESETGLKGYSIDLWNRIAEEIGRPFEITVVQTVPDLLGAVSGGEADIGVGAISITDEREKKMDFSHPFYESGLQVLVRSDLQPASILRSFGQLFSGPMIQAVLIVIGAVLLVSHILWSFERRVNHAEFPASYPRGLRESIWWSISTMISGGCENKAPVGTPGRLVAVLWMLAPVALTSFVTATLASAMTVNSLTTGIASLSDLASSKIGSVRGSSAAAYLEKRKYRLQTFANVEEAIRALEQNRVKAVVYDSPMLQYYVAKHPNSKLQVVGPLFEMQDYGFALPLKSGLRKEINAAIHQLKFSGYLDELERKWLTNAGI